MDLLLIIRLSTWHFAYAADIRLMQCALLIQYLIKLLLSLFTTAMNFNGRFQERNTQQLLFLINNVIAIKVDIMTNQVLVR